MKKKKLPFLTVPAVLLTASALLLAGSTVGSARAALTYFSEDYSAQVSTSRIGVSLEENGKTVSSRDYTEENTWAETQGTLFTGLFGEDGASLKLGQKYDDTITVRNSGSIDTFVRVIVKKSWTDGEGKKDTDLDPALIHLDYLTDNGWIVDGEASTQERTVLYYSQLLAAGESTAPFLGKGALQIDPSVGSKVEQETEETAEGTVVRTTYAYDGYRFQVEVEADAVQTHNAADAIKSAWGVDVAVSEDGNSISLQ